MRQWRPMAYSFAHYCPACRVPSDVYINESQRPEGSPTYRYQCPRCRQTVTYAPFLFLSKTAIPVDSVVATRYSGEATPAVASAPAFPKTASDSLPGSYATEKRETPSAEPK